MPRRYRIGVVGFGVAGSAAAYLLARDGHEVTLIERAPRLSAYGAGILLQCSGQRVLEQMDLLDAVLVRAAPLDELHARQVGGSTLIRTVYGDYAPGCRAYGVHRGVMFNVLHEAVRSQPIEVRTGTEIVGREVSRGQTYLHDDQGTRHGPFDLVIGCDGARSRLRAACGLHARILRYGHGTLWFIGPGAGVPGKLLQVVRGNRQLFGLLPLGDGLCTLYWGIPARSFDALRERGLDRLKRDILAFAPESEPLLEFLLDFDQLLLTTYQHVHMGRWHDAHTLFLGDACHAMSPHLGQGMNLALVDAFRFAACLRDSPTPLAAFRAFHDVQRAYLRYYASVTWLLSPFFQSDLSLLAVGRDLGLPLLPYVPFVKRQMLMTVTGLKSGFFGGEMRL